MQRVTITIDDDLLAEIDRLVAARGYQGRSEAMRDLARAALQQILLDTDPEGACVAALVYVYDHGARDLAARLAKLFHDHHDLSVAITHLPLNHESGLEVALLRGTARAVRILSDAILAERGVRHGRTLIVPVAIEEGAHSHRLGEHSHTHYRTR